MAWEVGTDAQWRVGQALCEWMEQKFAATPYKALLPRQHINYLKMGERAKAGIVVRVTFVSGAPTPIYFPTADGNCVEDNHRINITVNGDDKSGGAEAVSKVASAVKSLFDSALLNPALYDELNGLGLYNLRPDPEPIESTQEGNEGPFFQSPVSLFLTTDTLV